MVNQSRRLTTWRHLKPPPIVHPPIHPLICFAPSSHHPPIYSRPPSTHPLAPTPLFIRNQKNPEPTHAVTKTPFQNAGAPPPSLPSSSSSSPVSGLCLLWWQYPSPPKPRKLEAHSSIRPADRRENANLPKRKLSHAKRGKGKRKEKTRREKRQGEKEQACRKGKKRGENALLTR
ncbi:hypothetical protein BC567DRAFT_86807 [Phyllosticta citribraziliensis]